MWFFYHSNSTNALLFGGSLGGYLTVCQDKLQKHHVTQRHQLDLPCNCQIWFDPRFVVGSFHDSPKKQVALFGIWAVENS